MAKSGQVSTTVMDSFMRLARNLRAGDIDFDHSPNSGHINLSQIDWEKLTTEKPLEQANSVSSRIAGRSRNDRHKVVIDLDMDAALIATSTPGHHHLMIDCDLSWNEYSFLLTAFKMVGLIETGYWEASMARKASWIRAPWTRK